MFVCLPFRLSLSIEPSLPKIDTNSTKEFRRLREETLSDSSDDSLLHPRTASRGLNPKAASLTLAESPFRSPPPEHRKFTPGHRKAKSLGSHSQFREVFAHHHSSISSSLSSAGSRSLLDDSVVEEGNSDITGWFLLLSTFQSLL